jgi:hypothetical protein
MKSRPSRLKKINPLEVPCKKTIYNSLVEAKEAIAYHQENKFVKNLSAYKCSVCGFWHLTSK